VKTNPKALVMGHTFELYLANCRLVTLSLKIFMHDAFTEGTGIGQEYFYSDLRRIKTSTRKDGQNKMKWNEEDMVDYNDCYLECD
jgi:hypothetical protein